MLSNVERVNEYISQNQIKALTIDFLQQIKNLPDTIEYCLINMLLKKSLFLQLMGAKENKLSYLHRMVNLFDTRPSNLDHYSRLNDINFVIKEIILSHDDKFVISIDKIREKIKEYIVLFDDNNYFNMQNTMQIKELRNIDIILPLKKSITIDVNSIKDGKFFLNSSEFRTYTKYYQVMYDERNKIAHNSRSFLINKSANFVEDIKYQNYFVYYCVLFIMDEIFIQIVENFWKSFEE